MYMPILNIINLEVFTTTKQSPPGWVIYSHGEWWNVVYYSFMDIFVIKNLQNGDDKKNTLCNFGEYILAICGYSSDKSKSMKFDREVEK